MNYSLWEQIAVNLTAFIYLTSLGSTLAFVIKKAPEFEKLSRFSLYVGLITHTFLLVNRTYEAGHAPFTNLYETLLIFSWGISAISAYLVGRRGYVTLNLVATPLALGALIYATQLDNAIKALPPVLHSSWLVVHVTLAIISYGAFAMSGGLGILYLGAFKHSEDSTPRFAYLPPPEAIAKLINSLISWAFPALLLVIATGAIWAQQAWGAYWSWDPKETWALITAIVYAAYLWLYRQRGLSGKQNAWFAIIGFMVVLFCYLGVNLLMGGLHSYGHN